jgi:hypothetical protein
MPPASEWPKLAPRSSKGQFGTDIQVLLLHKLINNTLIFTIKIINKYMRLEPFEIDLGTEAQYNLCQGQILFEWMDGCEG